MSSRNKFYTEDVPTKERVFIQMDDCPIDKPFTMQCLKDGIFDNIYPRRPLPGTCALSVGKDGEKFHFVLECICSNAMVLDGTCGGHNREWLFDNITDTLQVMSELLDYIPEAVESLEAA